ncbi:urease accessory protein UreF [Planomonospora sp. ID67723]|uniref:urease accessory protein UreF n=1 Tax=Planomonospora sp. ID67723 TaxID=2738134 RepID=UPI0018C41FDC|nr:urease accessory UreF family protein [Planomonospora sp. ID67723]MBG0828946.1 urease accessory protein UreF [Planomonospora sp. ID67723]
MGVPAANAALLLLTDSRLPAGGHGHSGGAEAAVSSGVVRDLTTLAAFLRGRLAASGRVAACLAAAACALGTAGPAAAGRPDEDHPAGWAGLDAEADARTASPAQREASRVQGRLLLRTARRIWPSPVLDELARAVPSGAHHPVALGAAAGAAGCAPGEAALAAAYAALTGPATAAVRLLGLDPVAVHRLLADLAPDLERIASAAAAPPDLAAASTWAGLPAHAAPALDLLAERHLRAELRLFVS